MRFLLPIFFILLFLFMSINAFTKTGGFLGITGAYGYGTVNNSSTVQDMGGGLLFGYKWKQFGFKIETGGSSTKYDAITLLNGKFALLFDLIPV